MVGRARRLTKYKNGHLFYYKNLKKKKAGGAIVLQKYLNQKIQIFLWSRWQGSNL